LIQSIKQITKLPVIIFPGDSSQISNEADGILLLSLISGRNPEYLIGQHVASASRLKQSKLQILPTGYLLIESGTVTTAQYVSNTVPLPSEKPEIAANTALAGELLGMKLIYMDAGSGAKRSITEECIMAVRDTISIPLIIGGGINSIEKANAAWNAGADMVVVGTLFEKQPGAITLFSKR
ncbi:MAG: geranylgeranylglyceryl/heptaprenylglyceryl phosphate synthase, partial [Flavobacteriales bacterium]